MAKKEIEINVKTSSGYDQLYPINKTTVVAISPEVPYVIEDWTYDDDTDTYYAEVPFYDIDENYVPFVNISEHTDLISGCESLSHKIKLVAEISPTTNLTVDAMVGVKGVIING